jgi:hypothetical protein
METELLVILLVAMFAGGTAALGLAFLVRSRRAHKYLAGSNEPTAALEPRSKVTHTQEALHFASLVQDERRPE